MPFCHLSFRLVRHVVSKNEMALGLYKLEWYHISSIFKISEFINPIKSTFMNTIISKKTPPIGLRYQMKPLSRIPFNIVKNNEYWRLEMPVIGYGKKDIQISLNNMNIHVQSTAPSTFKFSPEINIQFHIPTDVKVEGIEANINNGLLQIMLPKKPIHQITIK